MAHDTSRVRGCVASNDAIWLDGSFHPDMSAMMRIPSGHADPGLKILKKEPMYPKQIAYKLKIHEQNIYYYIRKLEAAGLIKIEMEEMMQGTKAKFYTLTSDSFYFRVGDFFYTQIIG